MTARRKILVMGLPGAGKTTLSVALAARLGAVHFNADEVRARVNKDLGFAPADRVEQAARMGWLADQVVRGGGIAIADFVCPTAECRAAFTADAPALIVWCDRIKASRFADTNALFAGPLAWDVRVEPHGAPEYWAERIAELVRPAFDPKLPTALFVGRWQPFHAGHKALIAEGIGRVGQACVAVRDTAGDVDGNNPFAFHAVRDRIEHALAEHDGRFVVVPLPNIAAIFYGRDVGYAVERIDLDPSLQAISATAARARLFGTALA